MQKVVCGVCGLVNLESFPTYPFCAGCGVRLPQRKPRPLHDFFQRPVKTLVWAFSIAASVAVLALLSTGIARETRIRDRGALLVGYSLNSDSETGGANLILSLNVSTSLANDNESIRNLRLRLNQKAAQEAGFQVLSPPASLETLGDGRYFVWKAFPPGQTIKVRLHPHRLLKLTLVANGFTPFELKISPAKNGTPLGLILNRSH